MIGFGQKSFTKYHIFFVSRAPDKSPSDSKEVQYGSVVLKDKIIKSELIDHEEIKVEINHLRFFEDISISRTSSKLELLIVKIRRKNDEPFY